MKGWEVVDTFIDHGVSGSKERRPSLDRMLAAARDRRFDVVVCWRSDRLFRSLKQMVVTLDDLSKIGVGFVSATLPRSKAPIRSFNKLDDLGVRRHGEADNPDRIGFEGNGYRTRILGEKAFDGAFEDFAGLILPRLEEAHPVLEPAGSLVLHIDDREEHYWELYLHQLFGRASVRQGRHHDIPR